MAAAFMFSASTASPAIADGVVVEANGARSEGVWGGELGVGYAVGAGGFKIRPMGGVLIYAGDNDRYYEDNLSNGQTRCRDTTNGQFADSEKCDNTALKAYAKLEASYTLPASFEFGAGGRYDGGKVRPYGLISFPVAPKFRVQGNAGDKYFALGVRGSF